MNKPDAVEAKNLPPEDINYLLRKHGFRQKDIVKETKLSQPTISQVVNSQTVNLLAMDTIGRLVNRPPWTLWSDTYPGERNIQKWTQNMENAVSQSI